MNWTRRAVLAGRRGLNIINIFIEISGPEHRTKAGLGITRVVLLTIMRPSIRVSVFSKSQICILCLLCRNLKIRFCKQEEGVRSRYGERKLN